MDSLNTNSAGNSFSSVDDGDFSLDTDFPVIPVAPVLDAPLTFPTDGGASTYALLSDPDYTFRDLEGIDLGGGFIDQEAFQTGQQAFQSLIDDEANLDYLDGSDGSALSYNIATSFNDYNYAVVPAPEGFSGTTTAVSAQLDAYSARVGVPGDRDFESRVVFTDGFDDEGTSSALAAYNNDTGQIAVSTAGLSGDLADYGDTLLHEGAHAILDDSGLSDQIGANVPDVDENADRSLSLEEGIAEYAIGLIDPSRTVVDPAYQDEVGFVTGELIPRINAQGLDADTVLESAFGGDLGAQQTVVNAARDAYGLPPVELDGSIGGSFGVRDRLAANSAVPILPFESIDFETNQDFGYFVGNQLDGVGLTGLPDDELDTLGALLSVSGNLETLPGTYDADIVVGGLLGGELAGQVSDPNAVATWVSAGYGETLFTSPAFRAEIVNHPRSLAAAIAVDPIAFESSGAADDPAIRAVVRNDLLGGYASDLGGDGFTVDVTTPGATISNGQVVSAATAAAFGDDLDAATAQFNSARQSNDILYAVADTNGGLDLGVEDFEHYVTIGIDESGRTTTDFDNDLFDPG